MLLISVRSHSLVILLKKVNDPGVPVSAQECHEFWDFVPFSHSVPRLVAWDSKLSVAIVNGQVDYSHVLYALNASLVALVYDDSIVSAPKFNVVSAISPTSQLVGMGIVRGIEKKDDAVTFSIITPLDQPELERVNVLVRAAGAEIPLCLFTKGFEVRFT